MSPMPAKIVFWTDRIHQDEALSHLWMIRNPENLEVHFISGHSRTYLSRDLQRSVGVSSIDVC